MEDILKLLYIGAAAVIFAAAVSVMFMFFNSFKSDNSKGYLDRKEPVIYSDK